MQIGTNERWSFMVTSACACTRRGFASTGVLILLVTLSLPSDARPDEAKKQKTFNTVTGCYGAVELAQSGQPFFRTFFSRGWPTTKKVKDLTLRDSQGSAEDTLVSLMASGMGIRFTDSTYMDYLKRSDLKKGGRAWNRSSDVVTDKLSEFAEIAGLEKGKQFTPIVLEYSQGNPRFKGGYKAQKLSTQQWVTTGVNTKELSMDAISMSLYSQALFARQQLADSKRLLGTKKYAFGTNPESAFYALISLQLAIAKLHEIKTRGIVYKNKLGIYKGLSRYSMTGTRAWIPHRVKVKGRGATLAFVADKQKDALQSQLFDQSILLLGCTELLKIVRWSARQIQPTSDNEKLLTTLFTRRKFARFEDFPIDPKSFELTIDMALFVVTNLQRLHFDVDRRTFRSRSSNNPEFEKVQTLSSADIGITLYALRSFLNEVDSLLASLSKSNNSLKARLIRKQRLAKTQLKLLGRWTCKIINRKGFSDRYNIASQSPISKGFSAASLGFMVRGLLSLQSVSSANLPAADKEVAQTTAFKLLKLAESKLWNPNYKLYIGRALKMLPSASKPLKVDTFGQLAMIGAMRDLANSKNDVRYLIRFGEILGSLKARGFLNAETARGGDQGNDSDGDGVQTPDGSGQAPVLLPEVYLTK
jgi:hypothetical protein